MLSGMTAGGTDKTISASEGVAGGSDEELPAGAVVGEYVIESKLGEGGFGAVYRATHPVIGKTAAVKVLHRSFSSNAEIVGRFISEARAVNQIRHRSIVDIFAFGKLPDGRQYYVMELLEGLPLDKFLEQFGRVPLNVALPILRAVAKALDAAHAHGIVHRDLKPENVFLVTHDDGTYFPKLVDFGIAKLLGPDDVANAHAKTRTGTLIGTPYYMSPEQCRGIGVDHRTDIYAFGVMAHRMLSGHMPFDGQSSMDIMMKHVGTPPPSMSSVAPDVPRVLDAAILHMLDKSADARPQTVSAAVDALEAAAVSAGLALASVSGHALTSSPALMNQRGPAGISANQSGAVARSGITDMAMSSTPARSNRSVLIVALAAVAIAAIGAGVFMLRGHSPETTPKATPSLSAPDTSAQKTQTAPSITPASSAATSPPSTAPTPSEVLPATVSVRLDVTPKLADVWLGEKKLGAAPGPFTLPRSDKPVQLRVTARGFAQKTVEVSVARDGETTVTLVPVAAGKASGKSISGDLENPFGN